MQAPKDQGTIGHRDMSSSGTVELAYSKLQGRGMGRAQRASSTVVFSLWLSANVLLYSITFPTQISHFSLSDSCKFPFVDLNTTPFIFRVSYLVFLLLLGFVPILASLVM